MSLAPLPAPDPQLDLLLERVIDVRPELVWAAWTTPEHLMRWFTPAPWKTVECEIDLRPGGIFRTVMESPEGERTPNVGCYLEVVPRERLTWTAALEPGFRPAKQEPQTGEGCGVGPFTAVIRMEPHGEGTRYSALALHRTPAECAAHEAMGFHEGWGAALDQLVALARTM